MMAAVMKDNEQSYQEPAGKQCQWQHKQIGNFPGKIDRRPRRKVTTQSGNQLPGSTPGAGFLEIGNNLFPCSNFCTVRFITILNWSKIWRGYGFRQVALKLNLMRNANTKI